jgi:hypothetical protein
MDSGGPSVQKTTFLQITRPITTPLRSQSTGVQLQLPASFCGSVPLRLRNRPICPSPTFTPICQLPYQRNSFPTSSALPSRMPLPTLHATLYPHSIPIARVRRKRTRLRSNGLIERAKSTTHTSTDLSESRIR